MTFHFSAFLPPFLTAWLSTPASLSVAVSNNSDYKKIITAMIYWKVIITHLEVYWMLYILSHLIPSTIHAVLFHSGILKHDSFKSLTPLKMTEERKELYQCKYNYW